MASYHSKACRLTEVVQAEIRQGKLLDTPFFPSESQLAERYGAYCRAMQDAGLEQEIERCSLFLDMAGLNPKYRPIEQKLCHPAEMLEKVIDQLETPCSLFCMNDYIANGVYRAAGSRRIGIDIAVVGFGDLPLARRLSPPLSTLRVNQRLLGYQAAKLLHRRIRREFSDPVHLKLPTETVRRKSS